MMVRNGIEGGGGEMPTVHEGLDIGRLSETLHGRPTLDNPFRVPLLLERDHFLLLMVPGDS